MKTRCSLLAFGALALCACSHHSDINEPVRDGIVFSAGMEIPTRTLVQEGGDQVLWEAGDEIKVFSGGLSGRFTSEVTDPIPQADFFGQLAGTGDGTTGYWAVYPFSEESSLDRDRIVTFIPSVQAARPGTFAQGANVSVARSQSYSLTFYNVCGGVRFKVRNSDVKHVRLKGNAHETIAGKVSIGWDSDGFPVIEEVSDAGYEISLSAPEADGVFGLDTWYYLTAIPGTFSQGVTLSLVHSDGSVEENVIPGPIQIKRRIFGTLSGIGHDTTPGEAAQLVRDGAVLLDSGNEADLKSAFNKFSEAVSAGADSSKLYLAYCYEYGMGTDQDLEKARQLYSEASAEGNEEAAMKKDQLVDGKTNAKIDIPGVTPRGLEQIVLLCNGRIRTPNGDGTFFSDESQVVATNADGELIYLSLRNPGREQNVEDLILNATETAVSILLWAVPFAFDGLTDKAFSVVREILLSFPETEALSAAIAECVSELGYLDQDRIATELDAALSRVGAMYGLDELDGLEPGSSSFPPVGVQPTSLWDRSSGMMKAQNIGIRSQVEPCFLWGSPYYSAWVGGTKAVLDSVEPSGAGRWKCRILFYNYEPIYLALMPGLLDGNYYYPVGEAFLDHIVKPQNVSYIYGMGGMDGLKSTIETVSKYFSDTAGWLKGTKDFGDGVWEATETVYEMEVTSENDALLVYTTGNCPQLFAYTMFKLAFSPVMKMIIDLDDDTVEDIVFNAFMKYGTDETFIRGSKKLLADKDISGFIDAIYDCCLDVLIDSIDEISSKAFEKAIQPRYRNKVKKWEDYAKVKANRDRIKAELGDLNYVKKLLKMEKIAINVFAWWFRQNAVSPFCIPFSFKDITPKVETRSSSVNDGAVMSTLSGSITNREIETLRTGFRIWKDGHPDFSVDMYSDRSTSRDFFLTLRYNDLLCAAQGWPLTGRYVFQAFAQDNNGGMYLGEEKVFTLSNGTFTYAVPEAVDLGLSVKWASFNLGATREAECGCYYAWGETDPKASYSWNSYKWCRMSGTALTRYNSNPELGDVDHAYSLDDYSFVDDAARVHLGAPWRIPTLSEMSELKDNCTWTWEERDDGVAGYRVTSKKAGYTDKSIFIPASGSRSGSSVGGVGETSHHWHSNVDGMSMNYAPVFYFDRTRIFLNNSERCYGLAIRPVCAPIVSVTGLSLDKRRLSFCVGDSFKLTATVTPENATDKTVRWSSSNPWTISVTDDGTVLARAEGSATITASSFDGTVSATCVVSAGPSSGGHEAVDLGLSVKWASCNVGASKPEGAGNYYAWGETEPKSVYRWENYKWVRDGQTSFKYKTKYTVPDGNVDCIWYDSDGNFIGDNLDILQPSDDAASANWGYAWHTPTYEEIRELCYGCTWTWSERNGTPGFIVTGTTGNSIFIPAAGYRKGESLISENSRIKMWSSSLSRAIYTNELVSKYTSFLEAYYYEAGNFLAPNSSDYPVWGLTIRPVRN